MFTSRRPLLLCVLLAFSLPACSSDPEESGVVLPGIDDGASAGQAATTVVSAGKAATLNLKSGAQLVIEAGSVDKDVEVGIERPKDSEAVELVKTIADTDKPASAPYVLTPHGTKFKKPVTLTVPIEKGADKNKLSFVYLVDENDKDWKPAGAAKVDNDKASIALDHFSVLILVERMGASSVDPVMDSGMGAPEGGLSRVDAGAMPRSDAGIVDAGCASTFSCGTNTAQCGVVTDNCGTAHPIASECARDCALDQVCTDNLCGPPPCVPTTCLAALGEFSCHPMVADGCGGTLDCSACPAYRGVPQTCKDIEPNASEQWACVLPCTNDSECPANYAECSGNQVNSFTFSCVLSTNTCGIGVVPTECPNGCENAACLP